MSESPQPPKHPRDMTTEEALQHIFHPKIVDHVKEIAANPKKIKVRKPQQEQ